MNRWFSFLAIMLLIASSEGKILIVDPAGNGDSKTISGAVALARPGDEIHVMPGDYLATTIDRSISIFGMGGVRIKGQGDSALIIVVPGCKVVNLSIEGRGSRPGVVLQSSDNLLNQCSIQWSSIGISVLGRNNTVQENQIESDLGIEIISSGCKVHNSTFKGNIGISMNNGSENDVRGCGILTATGLEIKSSTNNKIVGNSFSGTRQGIVLSKSNLNQLSKNDIFGPYLSGMDLVDSNQNILLGNRIEGCKLGFSLRRAEGNHIINNSCRRDERAGIYTNGSSANELIGNEVSYNGNGILIANSAKNLLRDNTAIGNKYGISLRGSSMNVLKNNSLKANYYNLRIDEGETAGRSSISSRQDPFVQEIDPSNLVDGRPICYLVGERNIEVPQGCGFVGLIGCQNIKASNQTISNSSAGILIVNSTQCSIEGCSLSKSESGISLLDSKIWTIKRCRANKCKTGFLASKSANGLFEDDSAFNCSENGFKAEGALNLTLKKSSAILSGTGVSIRDSRLCNVVNCSSKGNREAGFGLTSSFMCLLRGNAASLNERGIALSGANSCILAFNNASENKQDGFFLVQLAGIEFVGNNALGNGQGAFIQSSKKVKIEDNNLSHNNRYGLKMSGSFDCNITENSFIRNIISGVNLVDCNGNLLYHNIFIENSYQNAVDNGDNQWDAGPKVGGNYWSDDKVEGNPGNVPRQIPTKGVDNYPYQIPGGWT